VPPTGEPPHPDQGLPGGPTAPDQGLPGSQYYWVVVGIPGIGWRYVCVDPSLHPDQGLPSAPPGVDNTLPPSGSPPTPTPV